MVYSVVFSFFLPTVSRGYNVGVLDACGVEIKLLGSVPVRSGMFADESVKAPKGLTQTGMIGVIGGKPSRKP